MKVKHYISFWASDCSWDLVYEVIRLFLSWVSFVIIDYRMLKIITFVFIVTRRLEKHSILKFTCFKLLGHCNRFTCFTFFWHFMTFSVYWLLDRSCLHFFSIWLLTCVFWHTVFSIWFSASAFWHTVLSISSAFLR